MRFLPLLLGATPALASVVILPGGDPRPFKGTNHRAPAANEHAFFNGSAENEFANKQQPKVILSSFALKEGGLRSSDNIYSSGDSFVRGALQAWGEHLHLVIRPEEVWFTILVQMNFFMNANAESLRYMFVDHEGQEVIHIEDYTWYDVLRRFQYAIQDRVKTPWLLDWIRPNFTTTTESDIMTANVLMMGLTQAYFKFEGSLVCGLPSVTLLGEEKDWLAILAKLDRLKDFGPDPELYATRLRPILSRFVRSFREPDSAEIRDFWNNIAIAQSIQFCGAPPITLSGWITAFQFWDRNGFKYGRGSGGLVLDGVSYPAVDMLKIPIGYARAPFIMRDWENVDRFEAFVAAGLMGKRITPGAPEGYAEALKRAGGDLGLLSEEKKALHSTLQPMSAWVLYGPSAHNATREYWLEEEEMSEVYFAIKPKMVDNYCKAK